MEPASADTLLDQEWLLNRYRGDMAFVREVYQVFLQDAPERAGKLRQALDQGDAAAALPLAHSLKGMLGTIGALGSSQQAAELEEAVREADLPKARTCFDHLSGLLDRIVRVIQSEMAQPPNS